MGRSATADQREAMYGRLNLRNRLVSILRIGVPVLGALILVGIVGQIYLASLGIDFSIGRVSVQQDRIVVDVPRYDGVMADGAVYRVTAESASAALANVDVVDLVNAEASLHQPSGRIMSARAESAQLHMGSQRVEISGTAAIEDSFGTTGTLSDALVDWPAQTLIARGPVHFEFNDGSVIDGAGLIYDAAAQRWTFERATLTVPSRQMDEQSPTDEQGSQP
ncbi:hypothetical protein XM25_20085 [Devosia sp. H5989]|nr:hypothetical protein XM25_20085 [Devosia sp. H5989]